MDGSSGTDLPAENLAPVPIGRREAKKRDKLERIRRAAKHTFLNKGYEAATVREIANSANVAFGTLFLYATNKQDLLLLIFEEDFIILAEKAAGKVDPQAPVVDQLITFFNDFYEFFCSTPALSRDMLREVTFDSGGIVAARIWAGVQDIQLHLARLVARAQAEGLVSSSVSPDLAAHVIFSLHRIELRFCLGAEKPDIAASLERLRKQFDVLLVGLQPREVGAPGRVLDFPALRARAGQKGDRPD